EDENEENIIKIPKPPPIFVDGVSNIQPLYQMLNEIAKDSYDIKIVKSDQVKIQIKTADTYSVVVKELEAKHTQFYTYKPKQERCFKVVLRNIHPSINVNDLKNELKQLGHDVSNIWNMKHRVTKNPLPMFMIELLPNQNNKLIYEVQYLQHCKINFEPPRPKRAIPQCAKCQQYGHTKSYCHRPSKCVKCAGNHLTIDCPRKTRSDNVKCALCSGNHPANYKGCSVYQELHKSKFPPLRTPKPTQISKPRDQENSNKEKETYAEKLRQNQSDVEIKNNDMKNMMQMMQQIMQQLMTLTNLLVNLLPKTTQSVVMN
ncbi:hypothetical protein PSTG_17601, partial [Puccinia striiformis f. sp. tritici PST-78]